MESPRGVPQLSRTEVRRVAPSLSIRCTAKRVVSRVLAHEHRREFARRRETITRRTHGGTDMPSSFFDQKNKETMCGNPNFFLKKVGEEKIPKKIATKMEKLKRNKKSKKKKKQKIWKNAKIAKMEK